MKQLIQVFLILVVIVSCSDDDSIDNLPLIGTTWTEVSFEAKDCDDELDDRFIECSDDKCEVFILNEDGTVSFPNTDTDGIKFTYRIKENILTIIGTISDVKTSSSITYEVIGTELFFTQFKGGCTEILIYKGT